MTENIGYSNLGSELQIVEEVKFFTYLQLALYFGSYKFLTYKNHFHFIGREFISNNNNNDFLNHK